MPKPAVNAAERTRDEKPSKFALSPRKNETNADQQPKAISGKARISDEAARISCGTVGALCFRAVEAHGQNGRRRFPVLAGVETGSPTPAHRAQSAHVFGEISLPPSLPPSFLSYVPLLNSFSHSLPSDQRPFCRARRPDITRTAGLRPPPVVSSYAGLAVSTVSAVSAMRDRTGKCGGRFPGSAACLDAIGSRRSPAQQLAPDPAQERRLEP